jgi:hypothetical protein
VLQAAWEATRLSYSIQTLRTPGSKIAQSNSTLIDNSSLHIYIPLQSSRTLFLWCFSADNQRTPFSRCMKKWWKQTPNVVFLALTPKLREHLIKAGHMSTTPSMRDESLCAIIDLKKPCSSRNTRSFLLKEVPLRQADPILLLAGQNSSGLAAAAESRAAEYNQWRGDES